MFKISSPGKVWWSRCAPRIFSFFLSFSFSISQIIQYFD
jgi:hypothetical protein